MTKKSKSGFRARFSRAWDSTFGSPSSTPTSLPSPKPSSKVSPSLLVSPGASESLSVPSQAPLPASPLPVPASPQPAPSTLAPSLPATGPAIPSLQIPAHLCNPVSTSGKTDTWSGLSSALRTLHANSGLFPPLQSVVGNLLSCVEAFEISVNHQREYEDLALELQTLSETLDRHLKGTDSSPMMAFIVKIMQSIQEQVDIIAKLHGHDPAKRALEAHQVREALAACYHHVQALCRQLQIDAGLSHNGTDKYNTQLKAMKPAKLAAFDSRLATDVNRRTCTKDTRTSVLLELSDWSTNPDAPNVCWMNGMAGTGKTTMACTFAEMLKARNQLAASFFCTRAADECRDVTRIIPTIAYQLARHSAPFRSALCRVLDDDPDAVLSKASTQCDRLLKRPLLEVKDEIRKGLVVVIDALDECTAANGVELVLDTLLQASPNLPLRFFVASRPEPKIWTKIQSQPKESRSVFILHNVKHSDVQADIEKYLQDELPLILPVQLKRLTELSGSLFIYAATAVRYIKAGELIGEFDECLERMLSVTQGSDAKHAEIDALYMAILTAADSIFPTIVTKAQMKLALWTAVCAREPVSVDTLAAIAGLGGTKKAMAMLRPLRSVLCVSESGDTVSTLHASFPDFILDRDRSLAFFCDARRHSQLITHNCFDVLKDKLRFNICRLESSYLSDAEVPDLKKRVEQTISPTLAYICRYWADHLGAAHASEDLRIKLFEFLRERLLFWMEVMNLKQWMAIGVHVILVAKQWLNSNYRSMESSRVIEDILQFVTSVAGNPVSQSTPHIYISALALCHRSSTVYKHYWERTRGLIDPQGPDFDNRRAVALASWPVGSLVNSVAYSPGGAHIAIGCYNGSVIVKDSYNGASTFPPLTGHARSVYSVAFSPDSSRLASGSDDHTIRVWNVKDGTLAYPPIEGHTGSVLSVAVSPDGRYIVSGSADRTVRVWNTRDGSPADEAPFKGHNDSVSSVAFSPTGEYIASGSEDKTIRMWNVQQGAAVGDPLEWRGSYVTSLAFSPDGTRLVSSSANETICIWNLRGSTVIGTPIIIRAGWVRSVAFSPSSTYIVSGSDDRTVRLWDARDGTPVGDPFVGHTNGVLSVAFSPDGTRIVSGSFDHSVRVWHAHTDAAAATTVQGHSRPVYCVASSSDGTQIVSGSMDQTVRFWNAQDGTLVGAALEGHTDIVRSVAFSPDSALVASGSDDRSIRVWNTQGASLVNTLEGHTQAVTCVAFSPDGTHLVSGSADSTVLIWDVQSGSAIGAPFGGHSTGVWAVAYSPDGTLIASGDSDGFICVWNVQDGSLLNPPYRGHASSVMSVAMSPDGKLVASGSIDCTIRLWNVQTGAAVGTPFEGHTDWVRSIVFTPDGQRIISGSDDRTIRVWSVRDGSTIGTPFGGHASYFVSVALSPDGTRIFSGAGDWSIRSWSLVDDAPTAFDTWTLSGDGWIRGRDSRLLFWVPPDVARILPSPFNHWVTRRYGPITADYSNLLLGEEWQGCFISK